MTWVLVIESGPMKGQELELLDQEIRVGRVEGNDIVVAESSISRHHCSIFIEDHVCFIQDMNSKNGTYLNDQKITKSRLSHGDTIRVGETLFRVLAESSEQDSEIVAKTQVEEVLPEKKSIKNFKLPDLKLKESPQGKMLLFVMCIVVPFILLGISRSFVSSSTQAEKVNKEEKVSEDLVPLSGIDPTDKASVAELRMKSDSALMMKDFPAAFIFLKKLHLAKPKDKRIEAQLKSVEEKLKKQIALHDENGLREYEKLNYDQSIVEWRKVGSLSKDFDPVRYEDIQLRIKEAEGKLVSARP